MNFKPHGYQKNAIKFLLERGCAGLFFDPGLGKTSTVYATFSILKNKGLVKDMLVVAPLRVANSVWPRELEKWDEFNHLKIRVLHGPNKDEYLREPHDISVVNPEGLHWLFQQGYTWDMLVVDESTKFKHTNTVRFKELKPWLNSFKRRYILTGSPAPNGLEDLFGQIYILDQGHALGKFITHYRRTYFDQAGFGNFTYVPRAGAAQAIQKKIEPLVVRLDAKDCIPLDPYIHNEIIVELPPTARKAYDQMEQLLITTVAEETVTAANVAAATIKCRQIANGGLYGIPEPGASRPTMQVHDVKTEAVVDLVEELNGKPCIIAYEFQHDLQRLQSAFPEAPYLGGSVTARRQKDIEDKWNAGLLPVLLAQPQSVAHGLNLQGVGAAIIWYALTWNLEEYEQLIRRVWRQGQTERIGVHHVIAKDTVDEIMMKAVKRKDRTQRALLDALREYSKEVMNREDMEKEPLCAL